MRRRVLLNDQRRNLSQLLNVNKSMTNKKYDFEIFTQLRGIVFRMRWFIAVAQIYCNLNCDRVEWGKARCPIRACGRSTNVFPIKTVTPPT